MKVVDPLVTNHTIVLLPRYYPTETLTLELTEEATGTTTTVANTFSVTDGLFSLSFTYDFTDKDKYTLKLLEAAEVVYRGKLIVTSQTAQEYSQTNGLYYYE